MITVIARSYDYIVDYPDAFEVIHIMAQLAYNFITILCLFLFQGIPQGKKS